MNMKQNKQRLYISNLDSKPIHKFFRVTISSIKYMKNTKSDIFSLHVHNNSPYKISLHLGLSGYFETNATISPTLEVTNRVNNILKLLDICQSAILHEELSYNNIIGDNNGTQTILQKHLILNQRFKYQNTPLNNLIPHNVHFSTFYPKRI